MIMSGVSSHDIYEIGNTIFGINGKNKNAQEESFDDDLAFLNDLPAGWGFDTTLEELEAKEALERQKEQERIKCIKLLAPMYLKDVALSESDQTLSFQGLMLQTIAKMFLKLVGTSEVNPAALEKLNFLFNLLSLRPFHDNNPACIERWAKTLPEDIRKDLKSKIDLLRFITRYPQLGKMKVGDLITIQSNQADEYFEGLQAQFHTYIRWIAGELVRYKKLCTFRNEDKDVRCQEIDSNNLKIKLEIKALGKKIKFLNKELKQLDVFKKITPDIKESTKSHNLSILKRLNSGCLEASNQFNKVSQLAFENLYFVYYMTMRDNMTSMESCANYCCLEAPLEFSAKEKRFEENETKLLASAVSDRLLFYPSILRCIYESPYDEKHQKKSLMSRILDTYVLQNRTAVSMIEGSDELDATYFNYEYLVKLFIDSSAAVKCCSLARHVIESYRDKVAALQAEPYDYSWLDEIDQCKRKKPCVQDAQSYAHEVQPADDLEEGEYDPDFGDITPDKEVEKPPKRTKYVFTGPEIRLENPIARQKETVRNSIQDAKYHYEVFTAAWKLYQTVNKKKGAIVSDVLFMLFRSSALVSEQMLTAQYFAKNAEVQYRHTHKTMATELGQNTHMSYLESVNGCVVYHRYPHLSRKKLERAGQPMPQTLKLLLNPQLCGEKKVDEFIWESMAFFTADHSLAKPQSDQEMAAEPSLLKPMLAKALSEDSKKVKTLIAAAIEQRNKQADENLKTTWQEVVHYLKGLDASLSCLTEFPQVQFFAAQVESILIKLQHIDEQLEVLMYHKQHNEDYRIHDLAEYRKLRDHAESEELQKVVANINVETGSQYPHKRLSELKKRHAKGESILTKPEAITLRLEAAEITRSNNSDALIDSYDEYKIVSQKHKAGSSVLQPSQIYQKLFVLLNGCLQMASDKMVLLR